MSDNLIAKPIYPFVYNFSELKSFLNVCECIRERY